MQKLSRRALARYAVDSISNGESPSKVASRLAAGLAASKKTGQVEQLLEDIAYELEDRKILSTAEVTSATKLNDGLRKELKDFIAKQTGAKAVVLNEKVDEQVIGGVRIETSKRQWDQTVKRRLTDIREAF